MQDGFRAGLLLMTSITTAIRAGIATGNEDTRFTQAIRLAVVLAAHHIAEEFLRESQNHQHRLPTQDFANIAHRHLAPLRAMTERGIR